MYDRLTKRERDEDGNATYVESIDIGLQKLLNKLADYEDKEEKYSRQTVTSSERELLDAIAESIVETESNSEYRFDIIKFAYEMVGAWMMLTSRWDSK